MNHSFHDLRPLSKGLPKIIVLSDFIWGPVARICRGLLEASMDLTIICLSKSSRYYAEHDPSLLALTEELTSNGKALLQKLLALSQFTLKKHPNRLSATAENASIDVALGGNLDEHPAFVEAGLVLVGLAPGLFNCESMQNYFKNKAVIYRLAAEHAYTGYCTYTAGCEKWKNAGCSRCPQLGPSTDGSDLAAKLFSRKQAAYAGLNMAIVTPSTWLGQNVRDSLLLNAFPQTTISTSVNLEMYTPQPGKISRMRLGLPPERKMILYGSGTFRKNKGFHLLLEALELLRGQWNGQAPILAFFGQNPPLKALPSGYDCLDLGYLDDTDKLAAAYAAADIFISPAFQDNLPNTVNEALSCGTPVICFNRFSSEDVVTEGMNGCLAAHPGMPFAPDGSLLQNPIYAVSPDKLEDLAAKIRHIVELPDDEYSSMRLRGRAKAVDDFSPVLQAARYLRLFRRMLGLTEIKIDGLPE